MLIAIAGAALCIAGCSPRAGLPSEYYRTDVNVIENDGHGYSAYINQGSAFGVSIGMDRMLAKNIITSDKKIRFFTSAFQTFAGGSHSCPSHGRPMLSAA